MCNNTVLEPKAKAGSLSCRLPQVTPSCPYLPSVRPPAADYFYPRRWTSTSVPVEQSLSFLSYDKESGLQ